MGWYIACTYYVLVVILLLLNTNIIQCLWNTSCCSEMHRWCVCCTWMRQIDWPTTCMITSILIKCFCSEKEFTSLYSLNTKFFWFVHSVCFAPRWRAAFEWCVLIFLPGRAHNDTHVAARHMPTCISKDIYLHANTTDHDSSVSCCRKQMALAQFWFDNRPHSNIRPSTCSACRQALDAFQLHVFARGRHMLRGLSLQIFSILYWFCCCHLTSDLSGISVDKNRKLTQKDQACIP